jgi:chorismate mutase
MGTRGVRGATTVDRNDAAAIRERTLELLRVLIDSNGIRPEDVASATFSATRDLDADFPALAVRSLQGREEVPLLCGREIPVPGSLGACSSSGTPTLRDVDKYLWFVEAHNETAD